MAHPYHHARSSARRLGGVYTDYIHLHNWMDHTKSHIGDARHRLLLHNSWGIFLGEQIFGATFKRESDGHVMATRLILEQHVLEDLGHIPSLSECFVNVSVEKWMYRNVKPLSLTLAAEEEEPAEGARTQEVPIPTGMATIEIPIEEQLL